MDLHKAIILHSHMAAMWYLYFITSAEEGYVFSLVCLSVCQSDYSQTCERIMMNFLEG